MKKGDKVLVRKFEDLLSEYGSRTHIPGGYFTSQMISLCGSVMTIKFIKNGTEEIADYDANEDHLGVCLEETLFIFPLCSLTPIDTHEDTGDISADELFDYIAGINE